MAYWKSLELDRLDDEVIDANVVAAEDRPSLRTINVMWHLGGAMRRVEPDETAYDDRDPTYLLSLDSIWTDPADTEENVEWTREAWADMHRFSDGGLYLNFAGFSEEGEELIRSATGRENYDRLVALKDEYDPQNLFRPNQNVRPTARSLATEKRELIEEPSRFSCWTVLNTHPVFSNPFLILLW